MPPTMETLFKYNSVEYWEKSNKNWVLILRIIAGSYMIAGLVYFYPGWNGDKNWWNLVIAIVYIIGGAFCMFFPRYRPWPNSLGANFVTIDDKKIRWSRGIFVKPSELMIADIENFKVLIGEVHFTTTRGEVVKLPIHMIEDKEKHDEFMRMVREGFGKEASLISI